MAGIQRAACRKSSMKSIIHQACLQEVILPVSMKMLWSPSSSFLFLPLPVITMCSSLCLDFSHHGYKSGLQMELGCVLLLHRTFGGGSRSLLCFLRKRHYCHMHQTSLFHFQSKILVCMTATQLLSLSHCLNLGTCLILPKHEPHKALTVSDSNRFIDPSLQCCSLEDEVCSLKEQRSSSFALVEFFLKCIIHLSPKKEPFPHVLLCSETWWVCDWLDPGCTYLILYDFKFLLGTDDLFGLLFHFILTKCLCLLGIITTMNPGNFLDLKKGNWT